MSARRTHLRLVGGTAVSSVPSVADEPAFVPDAEESELLHHLRRDPARVFRLLAAFAEMPDGLPAAEYTRRLQVIEARQ